MTTAKRKSITRTHTRRLLKLADILRKQRDGKSKKTTFDMHTWGTHMDVSHEPSLKEGFCGTSACALGHAAMDPEFDRCGLKIRFKKMKGWWNEEEKLVEQDKEYYNADVFFKGFIGEDAGARFFGLTKREAEYVFLKTSSTKKEVIKKLVTLAKKRAEITGECYYLSEIYDGDIY